MSTSFVIGDFELRPDERRLVSRGQPVALGSRAFDLLLCLVEQRDRVLTKDELLRRVWPGRVVEENNLSVHMSALRKVLGAAAVSTVVGRGYRFVMPVREVVTQPPAAEGGAELALPDKPSIVVLPFENLGGDAAQEAFVDGITEDVTTELSRFHTLFVIARNSAFTYKGRTFDVRVVAHELGVQFVLEGSVRCAGGRVRVTAQLIDAVAGTHVWAERFDGEGTEPFAVQSELAQVIVAAIARQIYRVELHRAQAAPPRHPTAHAIAMRAQQAWRLAARDTDRGRNEEALRLAREALGIDPRCSVAWRTIALASWLPAYLGPHDRAADALAEGIAAAARAIELDADDHVAFVCRGFLLSHAGRPGEGLADFRQAHEINPNDPVALASLGAYEAGAGDPQSGLRHVADAMRLSPRDPQQWSYFFWRAIACIFAGEYAQAADWARRGIADAPRFFNGHLALAVASVALGDAETAREHLATMRSLAPYATELRLAGHWPYACATSVRRVTKLLQVAAGAREV